MIVLASDHAGFILKEKVKKYLTKQKIAYVDLGTDSNESVDYPVYAKKMAEYMLENKNSQGILICGTGIGMSIAINRFKHIRGALCHNKQTAKLSREHNNANVLILAGRSKKTLISYKSLVKAFLTTKFLGGRHQKRVDMLSNL